MKRRKLEELTYSNKEISGAIHSAVIAASRSSKLAVDDGMVRRLRTYTTAVLKPLRQHTEDEELHFTPEMLVVVLLTAAEFVQLLDVQQLENSPFDQGGVLGHVGKYKK